MVKRTPGQSAGLTRERIATAAVALVDRSGLEGFGVRRLAADLGVDPMSIYNHVRGVAALLDAVSEAVLLEAFALAEDAGDSRGSWWEVARDLAHTYRDVAHRHPRVFPLLTTRAQTSPLALTALERLCDAMRRDGLDDQTIADAPLTLFGFLNGYLLATLSVGVQESASTPAVDPAEYPTLAKLAPLQADFGSRDEFDRMLDTVLTGISRPSGSGG